MHIDKLLLHRFRNYRQAEAHFAPGVNLVTGKNGQGKTNLLEALHYVCLAHSHRTRRDKDLIAFNEPGFVVRIEGEIEGRPHSQSVEYLESGQKRVRVDAVEHRRLSALLGHFSVVSLSPEDLEIVTGAPALRRRFLDSFLCQASPLYLDALRRYNQTLKERNSLLKQWNRFLSQGGEDLWEVYSRQLAGSGAALTRERKLLLAELDPLTREAYARIGQDREGLALLLECSFSQAIEAPELEADFYAKLLQQKDLEVRLESTMSGPHRDDLLFFLLQKKDDLASSHSCLARDFASQGQKRTIALSLKWAAATLLEQKTGRFPILLLDDVFAELDEARRRQLGLLVNRHSQVFLANARAADLPFAVERVLEVEGGRIR